MFGNKNRIVIKISGMNCAHCAAAVKQALEAIDGVKKVDVDLKKGEAYVTVENNINISADVFEKAIEEAGFKAEGFGNFKFL